MHGDGVGYREALDVPVVSGKVERAHTKEPMCCLGCSSSHCFSGSWKLREAKGVWRLEVGEGMNGEVILHSGD